MNLSEVACCNFSPRVDQCLCRDRRGGSSPSVCSSQGSSASCSPAEHSRQAGILTPDHLIRGGEEVEVEELLEEEVTEEVVLL